MSFFLLFSQLLLISVVVVLFSSCAKNLSSLSSYIHLMKMLKLINLSVSGIKVYWRFLPEKTRIK